MLEKLNALRKNTELRLKRERFIESEEEERSIEEVYSFAARNSKDRLWEEDIEVGSLEILGRMNIPGVVPFNVKEYMNLCDQLHLETRSDLVNLSLGQMRIPAKYPLRM